jgi:dipicolinate synthase subunit B
MTQTTVLPQGLRVAFALTGSYCTLAKAVTMMTELRQAGAKIIPIISYNVRDFDSRFGTSGEWRERISEASGGAEIIDTLSAAEPLGPKRMADIMLIAPCTGNSIAKLAHGVSDTPVLLAAKSHLRSERPLVVAVSSNDALSGNAANLGQLLNRRLYYFVPFGQDDAVAKPHSLVADMRQIPATLDAALSGRQLQPLLISHS